MSTGHLREGDADLMLATVLDAHHAHTAASEVLPWELFHGLLRLIPCEEISYQHHDPRVPCTLVYQGVGREGEHLGPWLASEPDPDAARFWELFWSSVCSWPQRTGDLMTVTLLSEHLPTRRARRSDALMRECLPEITDEIRVELPAPVGQVRRLLFFEDGGLFGERDRLVAQLMRPHVLELWRAAEVRRRGAPELTPREWQVLGLLATGLTASQVAHQLVVSPATVRKHAEHIRERLEVHTLREAAELVLPRGPRPR